MIISEENITCFLALLYMQMEKDEFKIFNSSCSIGICEDVKERLSTGISSFH